MASREIADVTYCVQMCEFMNTGLKDIRNNQKGLQKEPQLPTIKGPKKLYAYPM